jgi:hypothetical protein
VNADSGPERRAQKSHDIGRRIQETTDCDHNDERSKHHHEHQPEVPDPLHISYAPFRYTSLAANGDQQPYHDWNERIKAECYLCYAYARKAASRVLDDQKRTARIVSNYAKISFSPVALVIALGFVARSPRR